VQTWAQNSASELNDLEQLLSVDAAHLEILSSPGPVDLHEVWVIQCFTYLGIVVISQLGCGCFSNQPRHLRLVSSQSH